jgi:NAD(P)H-dependent flavin oxidoreductase YrpB (nitropropane dioxygenase family)
MTSLCRLLGIEVPIVQAPIGHASGPELVAGMTGEVEAMAQYAGQAAALVHDLPSASDLVPGLMSQSRQALTNALTHLQDGRS